MKNIVFTGNVDKRILVLPLLRGLSQTGETLLVTDDPNYLRGTNEAQIMGAIKVLFDYNITDDTVEDYEDGVDYINVVYDTMSFIPREYDKLVVCRHKDRQLTPNSVLEKVDEVDKNGDIVSPSSEVILSYFVDKKELKKTHYTDRGEHTDLTGKAELLELKGTDYKWIWFCSEMAEIPILKNAAITGLVAKLTAEAVGMSAKDWEAIINRQEN